MISGSEQTTDIAKEFPKTPWACLDHIEELPDTVWESINTAWKMTHGGWPDTDSARFVGEGAD
jgi:hypothetical protein